MSLRNLLIVFLLFQVSIILSQETNDTAEVYYFEDDGYYTFENRLFHSLDYNSFTLKKIPVITDASLADEMMEALFQADSINEASIIEYLKDKDTLLLSNLKKVVIDNIYVSKKFKYLEDSSYLFPNYINVFMYDEDIQALSSIYYYRATKN